MSKFKFTQKLVAITALASGLVWLLFGSVFFFVAKQSLEQQLTAYQVAAARDLMQIIDRSLFAAHQGIQVLAQDGDLIDLFTADRHTSEAASKKAVSEHLENISLLTGPWQVVSVFDREGNMVVSNMPEVAGASIVNHPEMEAAFTTAIRGQLYSSDIRLFSGNDRPSLVFSAPIRSQGLDEANVIGVVIGQYAWPVVTQLLDSVAPQVKAQLVRDDGVIIGTRTSQRHHVGSLLHEWSDVQSSTFNRGSVTLDSPATKGEPGALLVATRQSGYLGWPGEGWLLVLETPYKLLLAPVHNLAWQLALTALAGVIVLCGVLLIASVYLTRPIGIMSRAVRAFSHGDMTVRIDVDNKSKDEIADLARAFNAMAEDIGYYIEQVKENSEEVRSFAYIVSHDLRSPLVNLKGFSAEIGYSLDDLKKLLGPAINSLPEGQRAQAFVILDDDIPEALQFIGSSVERMDGQIQAVLKLSRLGRRELDWEQVNTATVVNQVLSTLQHQIQEKEIHLDVGALPVVEADAFALEQVFGNLLDNAVKYMAEVPGQIQIWSSVGKHEVTFHIRDNGPGIDAVNIPKAFELFRRVGRSDSPGEGMGLAYVKTLVRRHGGRIWCESLLGKGSTFSFSLAIAPSLQVRNLTT